MSEDREQIRAHLTKTEERKRRAKEFAKMTLLVIGGLCVLRLALTATKPKYEIKIATEQGGIRDDDLEHYSHAPPMYLTERYWWSWNREEYPLRFWHDEFWDKWEWQYEKDGDWKSIEPGFPEAEFVDLHYQFEFDDEEPPYQGY